MIELIFLLLFGHALADFSLQGDPMAKGKNRNKKPDYIPEGQKFIPCWHYWMSAHSLIHGGVVYLATGGNLLCGLIETISHFLIDFAKCENWTNPNQDQMLHVVFKAAYVCIIFV